jgi:hypothetical protein
LLLRRQRSGGSQFEASPGKTVPQTKSGKTHHKKGLVDWLKVQALSSNLSTAKKIYDLYESIRNLNGV